jgi:precorrin-6B methylase 2
MVTLVAAGAIVAVGDSAIRFGWADPAEHGRMLDDTRRTDAYVAAIRAAVRPDDVVLDIGTGSGILAMVAARAGARHVYAIEASDIATVAARVIEANGLSERITLVHDWSTEVRLPERATLLVTEIIGAEPLEEDLLRTTLDARRRLLTSDARLIPRRLELYARAVSVPRLERWASRIDLSSVEAWRRRYGLEFGTLWEARRRVPAHWTVEGMSAATWPPLGPPSRLVDIDLETVDSTSVEARAELTIEHGGSVDAILVTFMAELTDEIHLVGEPRRDESSSWDSSVWFLPEAIEVTEGSRLRVEYRFGVVGAPDGLRCELMVLRWPSRSLTGGSAHDGPGAPHGRHRLARLP